MIQIYIQCSYFLQLIFFSLKLKDIENIMIYNIAKCTKKMFKKKLEHWTAWKQ